MGTTPIDRSQERHTGTDGNPRRLSHRGATMRWMTDNEVIAAPELEGFELCWRPLGGRCALGSCAVTTAAFQRSVRNAWRFRTSRIGYTAAACSRKRSRARAA